MKAIVRHKYGTSDVLGLEDVDVPGLEDDRALVRVHAASVNALDWHLLRGLPYLVRLSEGLRRPKRSSMGVDVAGRVEAVGKNVTQFRPGDAAFGAGDGALAVCACSRALTRTGTYVIVGGPSGRWIRPMDRALGAAILSRFVRQRLLFFIAKLPKEDLILLKDLLEAGKVTPVIDRTYPLSETP